MGADPRTHTPHHHETRREGLHDLLLGSLNTYWEGSAGGELFNNNGKTDVLVRSDDRNVFIAECKIWSGPKAAAEAIDQLLGYLVWRDSKAALIMFIKTADPAATITKLHQAIEEHPRHVLTRASSDPSHQVDYILTADDEGRRIALAVIPVVLPRERGNSALPEVLVEGEHAGWEHDRLDGAARRELSGLDLVHRRVAVEQASVNDLPGLVVRDPDQQTEEPLAPWKALDEGCAIGRVLDLPLVGVAAHESVHHDRGERLRRLRVTVPVRENRLADERALLDQGGPGCIEPV